MRRARAAALVIIAGLFFVQPNPPDSDDDARVRALYRLLSDYRFAPLRSSVVRSYSPCDTARTHDPNDVQLRCFVPRPGSAEFERIDRATLALRRPGDSSSKDALHAFALVELLWPDSEGTASDRSLRLLGAAHMRAPSSASILSDIAVARYIRANSRRLPRDLYVALEYVNNAIEADSSFAAAHFNRALLLQTVGLTASAAQAWRKYLSMDSASAWASEARSHLEALDSAVNRVPWSDRVTEALQLDSVSRSARLAELALADPQRAREWAISTRLPDWGRAYLGSDSIGAMQALSDARVVGAALHADDGDLTIWRAVHSILDASPVVARKLADGHMAYAAAMAQYDGGEYDTAYEGLLRSRSALAAGPSPMMHWSDYFISAVRMFRGEYASAEKEFRRLHAVGVQQGLPALAGKSLWGIGVARLRQGAFEEASHHYAAARPPFLRAGEIENAGAVSYLLAESSMERGDRTAAYDALLQAVKELNRYRRSFWLANLLQVSAAFAAEDGLRSAAIELQNEGVAVAGSNGQAHLMATALTARARLLGQLGRSRQATLDLAVARQRMGSVADGVGRARLDADYRLAEAELALKEDAGTAVRMARAATEYYRARGLTMFVPSALSIQARAHLALQQPSNAMITLRDAIAVVEQQQWSFSSPVSRAAFYQTVEELFDQAIALAAENPDSAFAYSERGRYAFRDIGYRGSPKSRYRAPRYQDLQSVLPENTALVEYAVLSDRTIAFVATRDSFWARSISISRDSLADLVGNLDEQLSSDGALVAGAEIYRLLIETMEDLLAGVRSLVIVPDKELHRVPFAVLRSAESASFLVEAYTLRVAPSATFYIDARRRAQSHEISAPRTLIVNNPAFQATRFPRLAALSSADEEVAAVSAAYVETTVLADRAATRTALGQALRSHTMFHFAGHAVFNPDRPDQSFLVLADPGDGSSSVLTAGEIGNLRLSNLQAVVLSACSTLNAAAVRGGGLDGLAHGFLAAGVPALVGTLWDVGDAEASWLAARLHESYSRNRDLAFALREAQIAALRSDRPTLRRPKAWAAFEYVGG